MKDLILKTAFNRVFTTAFYKTLMDLQLTIFSIYGKCKKYRNLIKELQRTL